MNRMEVLAGAALGNAAAHPFNSLEAIEVAMSSSGTPLISNMSVGTTIGFMNG